MRLGLTLLASSTVPPPDPTFTTTLPEVTSADELTMNSVKPLPLSVSTVLGLSLP